VLGRSLDALPPQSRILLGLIAQWVSVRAGTEAVGRGDIRFTRRALREATGWGDTQLKLHLARLVELEHLLVHRAERGQGFVYELLYDGDGGAAPHLSGLIDPATLTTAGYDGRRSGAKAARSEEMEKQSPAGRGVVGGWPGAGRSEVAAKKTMPAMASPTAAEIVPESLFPPPPPLNGSHLPHPVLTASAIGIVP
jgi:hypothetical protein